MCCTGALPRPHSSRASPAELHHSFRIPQPPPGFQRTLRGTGTRLSPPLGATTPTVPEGPRGAAPTTAANRTAPQRGSSTQHRRFTRGAGAARGTQRRSSTPRLGATQQRRKSQRGRVTVPRAGRAMRAGEDCGRSLRRELFVIGHGHAAMREGPPAPNNPSRAPPAPQTARLLSPRTSGTAQRRAASTRVSAPRAAEITASRPDAAHRWPHPEAASPRAADHPEPHRLPPHRAAPRRALAALPVPSAPSRPRIPAPQPPPRGPARLSRPGSQTPLPNPSATIPDPRGAPRSPRTRPPTPTSASPPAAQPHFPPPGPPSLRRRPHSSSGLAA